MRDTPGPKVQIMRQSYSKNVIPSCSTESSTADMSGCAGNLLVELLDHAAFVAMILKLYTSSLSNVYSCQYYGVSIGVIEVGGCELECHTYPL